MLASERLDFSPIGQRPKLALPDDARLAIWVIVNVEEWDPTQPMPRTVLTPPAGGAPMPFQSRWSTICWATSRGGRPSRLPSGMAQFA